MSEKVATVAAPSGASGQGPQGPAGKTSRKGRRGRGNGGGGGVAGPPVVDVTYKVLLLGDSGVGKTALIRALMRSEFCTNHLTTVGQLSYIIILFLRHISYYLADYLPNLKLSLHLGVSPFRCGYR